ncbi:hypothetical protein BCV69DRAFT_58927 [Microstroma glucosiphilum]|uniref:Uncharacterized protein n=1 Tax=Pseudomicrostroma glucosiphilum TaxID=1684307 RepID=A0A316U2I6_9BASI|nr:hypothetical protein BCV69DRAFT_58927 [Pseudomicrostroma glucosiphilum]PWN19038.1 hypothetical protein BCV69DRAFT_58927 [Pseudomicrostroma glucosiphilum]
MLRRMFSGWIVQKGKGETGENQPPSPLIHPRRQILFSLEGEKRMTAAPETSQHRGISRSVSRSLRDSDHPPSIFAHGGSLTKCLGEQAERRGPSLAPCTGCASSERARERASARPSARLSDRQAGQADLAQPRPRAQKGQPLENGGGGEGAASSDRRDRTRPCASAVGQRRSEMADGIHEW